MYGEKLLVVEVVMSVLLQSFVSLLVKLVAVVYVWSQVKFRIILGALLSKPFSMTY